MSKRKLTYKNFKKYFSNNLPNKEKHDFEKDMMHDIFEEEAFDGLSKLSEEELENDIAELKTTINTRAKKKRIIMPVWFRYAASIILLVSIGFTIFFLNDRLWQDSMIKEQFSEDMEIMDSMFIQADLEQEIAPVQTKGDTTKEDINELVADNRDYESEDKIATIEDNIIIEDELILEDTEADVYDANDVEIIEFEEKEEILDDDVIVEEALVSEQALYAEAEIKTEENLAKESQENIIEVSSQKSSQPRAARAKKSENKSAPAKYKDNSTRVITGKVVGTEDNLSIPGVSIAVKDNLTIGTSTDMNGYFSLTIPANYNVEKLIASFVGMKSTEIDVTNNSDILVYMESDVLKMDEVVVTAVGIKREKREITYQSMLPKPSNRISKPNFENYIKEKIDYSKLSGYIGTYTLEFSFTVTAEGAITNYDFTQSPDELFNNEIIRVIKEFGNWIPSTKNGQKIESIVKFSFDIEVK